MKRVRSGSIIPSLVVILLTLVAPGVFAERVPPQTCVGDRNDDGMVSIDELIFAVEIAMGKGRDFCAVYDADRSGSVDVSDVVTAIGHALRGCGGPLRMDLSSFARFTFTRERALGFCLEPNEIYSAVLEHGGDGLALQLSILDVGEAGVDECLPEFHSDEPCFVARNEPVRYLEPDEIACVHDVFERVVIRGAPNPACRACIIDPCLINRVRWGSVAATDYICAERDRISEAQAAAILELLETLRLDGAGTA